MQTLEPTRPTTPNLLSITAEELSDLMEIEISKLPTEAKKPVPAVEQEREKATE